MKQINLLPADVAIKVTNQRTAAFVVLAVVLGVAAILVPWWTLRSLAAGIAENADTRLADITGSKVQEATDAETTRRLTDVSTRIRALNELSAAEVNWDAVFRLVSQQLPQDVALESLSLADGTSTVTARLSGSAPSNVSFVGFMEVLKAESSFKRITVDGFTYEPETGGVVFAITLDIQKDAVQYVSPAVP